MRERRKLLGLLCPNKIRLKSVVSKRLEKLLAITTSPQNAGFLSEIAWTCGRKRNAQGNQQLFRGLRRRLGVRVLSEVLCGAACFSVRTTLTGTNVNRWRSLCSLRVSRHICATKYCVRVNT